uniref:Uncharacterized protein n=1 Tax=Sipha flava TaxID=143950 RepID=A0A2S2R4J4_9HEMI
MPKKSVVRCDAFTQTEWNFGRRDFGSQTTPKCSDVEVQTTDIGIKPSTVQRKRKYLRPRGSYPRRRITVQSTKLAYRLRRPRKSPSPTPQTQGQWRNRKSITIMINYILN